MPYYGFGGWSPDGGRLLRMLEVGYSWTLVAVGADEGGVTSMAQEISTGSARNFPDMFDVSWQDVSP